jgi:hypothetical protein
VLFVVAIVAGAMLSPIPAVVLIHAWLIPMLIINTLVNIRGMSQHTLLEEASDDIRGTRSILTSRVVAFFMCNENYHLEHHLYPGVPWYNLPALHRATKEELSRRGAPYIRSYSSFRLAICPWQPATQPDGVGAMSTAWVDEALRMPVAFAQVREDPRVDLAVVERLRRGDLSGLMIASGGCTAAALVASGASRSCTWSMPTRPSSRSPG